MKTSEIPELVRENTTFALDLYHRLSAAAGNLFFSPYSISIALAMTYAGACANTAEQMARVLHFTLDPQKLHPAFASQQAKLRAAEMQGVQLKIANALWPQAGYPFLDAYLALIRVHYGEQITPLDYGDPEGARQAINTWVEEKTEAKIKDLIPTGLLNPLTRLVLTNAIYFKGNWQFPFGPEITRKDVFRTSLTESVPVSLMQQREAFGYAELPDLQILELPYAGNGLSMIVLLPTAEDGLAKLEANLTHENLSKWFKKLSSHEVIVHLPRFRFSAQFLLKDALFSLGMTDAFDAACANFAGMDGRENWLYISAVLHKAFVDVNEEGTEAAAATAVVMKALGMPAPSPVFRADHPFIFLIRENHTGSILFWGRMSNPLLS